MVALRLLWALCLCACFGIAPLRAELVDVGLAKEWSAHLIEQARVFQDPSASMGPEHVAALADGPGGFLGIEQVNDAGDISPLPWWTKVKLTNTGSTRQSLRLILNPGSAFHSADFYIQDNNQWLFAAPTADLAAADNPSVARFDMAAIALAPGQSKTVLIRTTGVAPAQLTPYLYSETRFNHYLARSAIWDGLLFGGLLALAWTACMLALFARSRGFLLLGLLSFATLLVEALRRGYGKLYVLTDTIEWGYRSPLVLGALTILLFILFVMEIARAEKVRLPLRALLAAWAIYHVAMVFLSAFGDVYHVHWLNENLRPFLGLTLLAIAILFVKQNAPTRKLMLAVAVFSLARASLITLETSGLLPEYIVNLSIGALRMNPVLALGSFFLNLTLLAGWVAHVGMQRKDALEKVARLQHEENERLAKEVARQTAALNKALEYADEKNRQQTRIAGYISHDLRAPLATISGYAKLMEQTASVEQQLQLNAIRRSVDYQMALIEDILGYASAELKPLPLEPAPTSLADYLDEVTQHATVLSRQQNNRFVIDVSGPIPKTIWIDGRRLRQVLLNLLSNAAKFTRGGTIRLDILAEPAGSHWQLQFIVSDSGIGMDIRKQAQIFKEFRQLESNSDGVGLGLYIAQSILRSMEAELSVQSGIGEGSAFSFQVNVAAADDQIVAWTAPATLPADEATALHAGTAMPPVHVRTDLAIMARGGRLTDIETWLSAAMAQYPACAAYFRRIHDALARLDLDTVERLALAGGGR